jgi:folate-binding protein YgfZ
MQQYPGCTLVYFTIPREDARVMAESSLEAAYASASDAALIVRHPDPGVVVMTGKDRLDLLHRMSTNDVAGLPAGRVRQTVLTNPIGRIIDVIRLLSLDDQAMLLTTPGRAEVVRKWLQGYIFFQDDVQLALADVSWSEWGIYGPGAGQEILSAFADAVLPGGEAFSRLQGGFAWRVNRPANGGFRLLLAPEPTGIAKEAWRGRGGEEVDAAAYQVLRIEAGIPEPDHEIRDDSIPLEVGLRDAISFTKGCYIGQEIIARMDSRGRQAWTMLGVRLENEGRPGDSLYLDDRQVGSLTSVAFSPSLGWIALASVRPGVLDNEQGRVGIGSEGSAGRVVRLPIAEAAVRSTMQGPESAARD